MNARKNYDNELKSHKHRNPEYAFFCYLYLFILFIALSGCAAISQEKVSSLETKNTDFRRYSVSYDLALSKGYDASTYSKLNTSIEKALKEQNRFRSVKHKKYGDADINILYSIAVNEKTDNRNLSFKKTNLYSVLLSIYSLGTIPFIWHSGSIDSNIEVSFKGKEHSFGLLDRYNYWVSIPSLITGIATGSLSTYSKLPKLLVQRTLEVMEASDIFEPTEKWEPLPATVSPDMIVDLHSRIPKAKAKNRNAVAVVIGNSKYQRSDVPDVRYAVSDANLVAKYLQVSMGYQPENIIYLENATFSDFRTVFGDEKSANARLSSYIQDEDTELFIYYQGHGAPNLSDNSAYLVPVDADPDRISFSGYAVDLLYNNLAKLNVKSSTVILDACFSGAAGDGKMLIKSASPLFIHVEAPEYNLANSAVITASSESQIASWFNDARHSILTYQFLVGLRGKADINEDGKISLKEMKDYLQNRRTGVPYLANRLYGREQMPQIWGDDNKIIFSN